MGGLVKGLGGRHRCNFQFRRLHVWLLAWRLICCRPLSPLPSALLQAGADPTLRHPSSGLTPAAEAASFGEGERGAGECWFRLHRTAHRGSAVAQCMQQIWCKTCQAVCLAHPGPRCMPSDDSSLRP